MKKKNKTQPLNSSSSTNESLPAPDRSRQFLRDLWVIASTRAGHSLSHKEFCQVLHVPGATLSNWQQRKRPLTQIEAVFKGLEALDERDWLPALRKHLTIKPSLEGSHFADAPVAISRLRAVLREPSGLTVISGPLEWARTWVVAALGHACAGTGNRAGRVAGLDLLRADWFQGVPGVVYLEQDDPAMLQDLRRKVNQHWAKLHGENVQFIFVNGIWTRCPERQRELMALAAKKHVFVADRMPGTRASLMRQLPPGVQAVHWIEVRMAQPGSLNIEFL